MSMIYMPVPALEYAPYKHQLLFRPRLRSMPSVFTGR